MQGGAAMKLIKNPHKAWSVWGIGLLGLAELVKTAWPTLQGVLPAHAYEWGTFYLILVVGVLRLIKQQVEDHYAE